MYWGIVKRLFVRKSQAFVALTVRFDCKFMQTMAQTIRWSRGGGVRQKIYFVNIKYISPIFHVFRFGLNVQQENSWWHKLFCSAWKSGLSGVKQLETKLFVHQHWLLLLFLNFNNKIHHSFTFTKAFAWRPNSDSKCWTHGLIMRDSRFLQSEIKAQKQSLLHHINNSLVG